MKTGRTLAPLAAALLLALPLGASAIPLTGAIGFGGTFAPTGGTDLGDATGINFQTAFVLVGSGDFAGIPVFTGASFTDFDFNPLNPSPVAPLWTVSSGGVDYSFDLAAVNIDLQNSDELNLTGTGTLMATGFDDTPAEWVFSGNAGGEIVFTFSTVTAVVPEPGTLTLVSLGLLLIGAHRRFEGAR